MRRFGGEPLEASRLAQASIGGEGIFPSHEEGKQRREYDYCKREPLRQLLRLFPAERFAAIIARVHEHIRNIPFAFLLYLFEVVILVHDSLLSSNWAVFILPTSYNPARKYISVTPPILGKSATYFEISFWGK
jgi:hypothetical protein